MTLAERAGLTVEHQAAALRREFDAWRARTQRGTRLEKHRSQVERITGGLGELLGRAPAASVDPAANLRARAIVQGAHVLWDFFRSKLALRDVEWLYEELRCVDELAWECYRPAVEAASAAGAVDPARLKEPPLVFFTADVSPFARTRSKLITARRLGPDDGSLFSTAVLSLPISVVGVPWFQLNYMPGAVVVAHEVGHAVANDLSVALTAAGRPGDGPRAQIEAAVGKLGLGGREAAWAAWCHELFADAYGVLCCGPAAVAGLAEYLADTPAAVADEDLPDQARLAAPDGGWGAYPTRYLRMLFNLELLRRLGLPDLGLRQEWEGAYGAAHRLAHFAGDIAAVAAAILDTPLAVFGGKAVCAVIGFSLADQQDVVQIADILIGNATPGKGTPFRKIIAGIALAYREHPQSFMQTYAEARPSLAARINLTIPGGDRNPPDERLAQPAAGQSAAALLADELEALLGALVAVAGAEEAHDG